MAQNTAPIFTQTPRLSFGVVSGSNNTYSMISGISASLFLAGPSGSYVSKIRLKPSGSVAATVVRVFLNSGSTTDNGNNSLYTEISLPSSTATATLAQPDFEIPMNIALPAYYRIFAVSATTLTTGYETTVVGGDY